MPISRLRSSNLLPQGGSKVLIATKLLIVTALVKPSVAGPLPTFESQLAPNQPVERSFERGFAPVPTQVIPVNTRPAVPEAHQLNTNWGYGTAENSYNGLICSSVSQCWARSEAPLAPLLFKSLLANESSFRCNAISHSGAAGLVQLMPDTARKFGLDLSERFDADLAVPVGVQVLQEKFQVIHDPVSYYGGDQAKRFPWSLKVATYYQTVGLPSGEDRWSLVLGAYNGGGGTILRAMAYAIDHGQDPRRWDVLAGPVGNHANTPLHQACNEVYGARNGLRKAGELAAYPRKILHLYHQSEGRNSNLQ